VTGVNSVLLTRDGTNFTPVRYPPRNLGIQTPKTWIQDRQGNDLYFILSNGIAGAAHRDLTNNFPFAATTTTREIIFDEAVTPNYAGAISSNGVPAIWRHQMGGGAPGGGHALTNPPAGLSGVVQLVFNDNKALALFSNGTVTNWGDNNNLQAPADLTNVRSIAIADNQGNQEKGAAILNGGSLRLFGSGINGQLNSIPTDATNIRSVRFFRDNIIAITSTNDGSRVIMWGSDNLQVPNEATNVESAFGFTFGDSTRFFVQARRYDGSLVIWGNVPSALTNVPSLTGIFRVTLIGTNFYGASDVRRYPYILAETTNGKIALWGGRLPEEGGDNYFGYLTNFSSPILSNVTKTTVYNYTNLNEFYPIIVAERGTNTPYVCANNSLSNVPAAATNVIRLRLTGGTNGGNENARPRFLVAETSDKRILVWSNGYMGGGSFGYLGGNTANVKNFKLVRGDSDGPVAVALLEDGTMRIWGGAVSQPQATNTIPLGVTNIRTFMVLDRAFTSEGSYSGSILIIANEQGGKLHAWWSDGQNTADMNWNALRSSLSNLRDLRLLPYDQEVLSSRIGSFHRSDGAPAEMGMRDWPIFLVPLNEADAQIQVVGKSLAPVGQPYTFTSIPTTQDNFSFENVESVIPIGRGDMSSWNFALKLKDGTMRLQSVSTTGSISSVWNRTSSYFSSPNASTPFVFTAKQLGFTSGNAGSSDDNLVIVAEPIQLSP